MTSKGGSGTNSTFSTPPVSPDVITESAPSLSVRTSVIYSSSRPPSDSCDQWKAGAPLTTRPGTFGYTTQAPSRPSATGTSPGYGWQRTANVDSSRPVVMESPTKSIGGVFSTLSNYNKGTSQSKTAEARAAFFANSNTNRTYRETKIE